MVTTEREVIRCSCCGQEILAERIGNTIVVRDRRHGKVHSVTIDLTRLLDKIHNTST